MLDLTKKAVIWHWGEPQHKAFEELKTRMCSRPVLTQPDFNKPFFLQTDASAYGVGAILSQEGEHHAVASQKPKLHPIAFYSATFTPTERNYDIYERELLAIMKALTHWRHYLGWTKTPFTILTDHTNLQYWKAPQKLNRRTAQWHADLQEYDFIIKHIPGKINTPADKLSRPPNSDQGDNNNKDQTLLEPKLFVNATHITQIPESSKRNLMTLIHDHPTAGHPGQDKTIQKAVETLSWTGMRQWIADYVKGCATCQQNKITTHRKKILLYRITTKEGTLPFQQIAMDLIMGLPQQHGHNAILTIVDHGCSHAAIFLPCSDTIIGPGIAQLYLDYVYRWFGLPTKMISDRDPRFTSQFGKALTEKLGIQRNLSTAFHPQTDGLSEQKNQWIEQYLWLVTLNDPKGWTHWLALTTMVHNNRINTTTGLSPNQILFRYNPTLNSDKVLQTHNALVESRIQTMTKNHADAIRALNKVTDQKGPPPSQFHLREQVWLDTSHLKLPHQKAKLTPKHLGLFKIIQEISPVAYRLELPPNWRIHYVFHASLLTPYYETAAHGPNFTRPPPDLIDGEEEYEVE